MPGWLRPWMQLISFSLLILESCLWREPDVLIRGFTSNSYAVHGYTAMLLCWGNKNQNVHIQNKRRDERHSKVLYRTWGLSLILMYNFVANYSQCISQWPGNLSLTICTHNYLLSFSESLTKSLLDLQRDHQSSELPFFIFCLSFALHQFGQEIFIG